MSRKIDSLIFPRAVVPAANMDMETHVTETETGAEAEAEAVVVNVDGHCGIVFG